MAFDFDSLGDLIKTVGAPLLGSVVKAVLPGAGGEIADKIINGLAKELGTAPTVDAIGTAIEADPAKGAAAANTVQLQNQDALSSALEARLKDVQDARATMVHLVDTGSVAQYGAPVVSIMVVALFATVVVVFTVKPVALSDVQSTLLNIIIGILGGGFTQVLNYWLGSSAGSARSADTIRNIATSAATPTTGQIAGKAVDAVIKAAKK